jgi:hypothetical protein
VAKEELLVVVLVMEAMVVRVLDYQLLVKTDFYG